MSLFGMIENAVDSVGDAVSGAVNGAAGALRNLLGGTETIAGTATMSPEALVKTITEGPGPEGLEGERQENETKAKTQDEIEAATRQHMTRLESAWTGAGADAARDKLQAATVPVSNSSQAMVTNANVINGQIESFTTLKNSLHTDVTDNPPQKSFWDSATPWDTDTEDAINANNAKVQENLQAYNTYAQTSQANTPQLKTDYGQVTQLGGDFQVEQQTVPPGKTGKENPETSIGTTNINNPRTSSTSTNPNSTSTTNRTTSVPRQTSISALDPNNLNTGRTGTSSGDTTGSRTGTGSGDIDDTTRTSGYTTPGGSTYRPSTLGSSFGSGSGSSSDYTSGGFGPVGAGGFGPIGAGGSGGGYGGGSSSGAGGAGSGSGALGAGKATGGVAAEAGAAGAASKAGAAGAAGRAGTSGMGGMGGAHGGKGQGGEDDEHTRPSWLVEEDPEGIFGTDEKTAPPVIGL